jgi:hypothetical protein
MYTTTPNTALAPAELAERYTVENLKEIVALAKDAAYRAADAYENDVMQGGWGACGFAWMNIYGIKGNTRIGRKLKQAGVEQSWDKSFQLWNPSGYPTQNVDTLEAGARAAAEVFKRYGFTAYAGSRLD